MRRELMAAFAVPLAHRAVTVAAVAEPEAEAAPAPARGPAKAA